MYISGSDIPIIMGVGSITPYELWLLKKGELEITETSQMKMGKALEPVIRSQYQSQINLTTGGWRSNQRIWEDNFLVDHKLGYEVKSKEMPYLIGHLDDYHIDNKIVAEFKATRNYIMTCPIKFQLQTAFYCMLTEAKEGHIAILHNTTDLTIYIYQRNEKLESLILDKASKFYENHLIKDESPSARTLEDVKNQNKDIYHHLRENAFIADKTIEGQLDHYKNCNEELKENAKHVDVLKLELIKQFQSHELITDEYDNVLATYKFNKTASPTVDKKMLQSEYPHVWEKVKIERTPTRIFRVKTQGK